MLDHAYRGQVGGVTAWSDADWTKEAGCIRIQTLYSAAAAADAVIFQLLLCADNRSSSNRPSSCEISDSSADNSDCITGPLSLHGFLLL